MDPKRSQSLQAFRVSKNWRNPKQLRFFHVRMKLLKGRLYTQLINGNYNNSCDLRLPEAHCTLTSCILSRFLSNKQERFSCEK